MQYIAQICLMIYIEAIKDHYISKKIFVFLKTNPLEQLNFQDFNISF